MRILDKYILRELMGPFLFGVASFSSVLIGTSTLFRIAQYVTKYGASIGTVSKLFVYSLPSIVVLTFPMSMLLASLLSIGRLSGASEITAMRSGGVSFIRLVTPVFIVSFLVSCFSVVFNECVVPEANSRYNQIVRYEIEKNLHPKTQEHIVIKTISDGVIQRLTYAKKFEEETNTMYGVSIQEFDSDKLVRVENAEKAVWEKEAWIMENGVVHDLTTEGAVARTMRFDRQLLPLDKNPSAISREQKRPEEMSIRELKIQIAALKKEYAASNFYEVELYQRLSIPMACFIFSLIGTPLGLQPNRSSSSIGLGLSIIIIFIYYTIMTVTSALGQGGALPPLLAVWIPNIIGLTVGGWLLWRSSK